MCTLNALRTSAPRKKIASAVLKARADPQCEVCRVFEVRLDPDRLRQKRERAEK